MTNMLRNSATGQFLRNHELLTLLGARSGKLPRDGFDKVVDGVTFRVSPAPEPVTIERFGRKILQKSSRHRVRYLCNCGQWVPYGRASQHKCK